MKKIYSIVLMAAALLVGTNVQAKTVAKIGTNEYETLKAAFDAAKEMTSGQTIVLQEDIDDDTYSASVSDLIKIFKDTSYVITLDLNGHSIVTENIITTFTFYRGKLYVTGTGVIFNNYGGETVPSAAKAGWEQKTYGAGTGAKEGTKYFRAKNGQAFWLSGAEDPTACIIGQTWTYLNIGENVEVKGHAIGIYTDKVKSEDVATTGYDNKPATDQYDAQGKKNSNPGTAFGVHVDVYGIVSGLKYGMQLSGNCGYWPAKDPVTEEITDNVPVYNIYGKVYNRGEHDWSAGVYGAGYAHWNVIGKDAEVYGTTGLYSKAGTVAIEDAKVYSNTTTIPYSPASAKSGIDGAAGSAIVMDSNKSYAGEIKITVSGDATITGATGKAVESYVSSTGIDSKVKGITIEGGTFVSGTEGCFDIAPVLADAADPTKGVEIVVSGGAFDTDIQNVLDVATGNHIVGQTTDESGKPQYVISPLPAGKSIEPSNTNINGRTDGYITWTDYAQPALTGNVTLEYLEMNGTSTVTVPSGKVLTVGHIVMSASSVITVESGGKLIITDPNGLVANKAANLVIKTAEGSPAYVLLAPEVQEKKHPMATVEFISNSFVNGSNWAVQRFGLPTYDGLISIDAVDPTTSAAVPTKFGMFNYSTNNWDEIGGINGKTPALDYSKISNAFDYYQMINYRTEPGTKVIMTGRLVGNEIPQLNVRGNFWNGYSNSLLGDMSIPALLDMIPNNVDKAIYLYEVGEIQATWEPITKLIQEGGVIQPMQPFLIRNAKAANVVDIDYATAVYNPTKNKIQARNRVANDWTMAKIIVKGENSRDRIVVAEGEEFTSEFDNGYDAVKYMNDGINMYVMAEDKMSNFATNDLNNTYVGFQTVKGGTYTIDFSNIMGEDLTLIDLETGARIAMVEGNVYEFTAAANTTNNYRFQIVGSHNAPTSVENVSAVNNGAVYTIMGQYVGEMTDWDILPAGIYVVDGVKRVK